jgi:hypothetical protein
MGELEDFLDRAAPIRKAFDRQPEEDGSAHTKRLTRYADVAMEAFRDTAGETLNPGDLMRCLLHWCDYNGYTAGGSVNGAKLSYSFDQGRGMAEWDERTWHVESAIKIPEANPDFPADPRNLEVIADQTGVLIFSATDPGMLTCARTTVDQHQAQRLSDFLTGWAREQRKPFTKNLRERVAAWFLRRR